MFCYVVAMFVNEHNFVTVGGPRNHGPTDYFDKFEKLVNKENFSRKVFLRVKILTI